MSLVGERRVAFLNSVVETHEQVAVKEMEMAEGVGFEPTVGLLLLLISSQVPLTTQPPFQPFIYNDL